MHSRMVAGFFDELHKIAATVLMKELAPSAKKFMQRMTGASGGASISQAPSARRLRHALTGAGKPELMTEMHGMGDLLSTSERSGRRQAKEHFEGVLQQQGKVYKGSPGFETDVQSIGGHPAQRTRTGAEVGPALVGPAGTVAARPMARRSVTSAPQNTSVTVASPARRPIATLLPGTAPVGAFA